MKKVVNASIGGRGFALDDDAYARLSAYFNHFKARLNKDSQSAMNEVMSDLEGRIAELFDQGIGGATYRVVDLDLVNRVVGQLGMPDGSAEPMDWGQGTSGAYGPSAGNGPSTSSGTGGSAGTGAPGPDFSYNGEKGEAKKRLYRDSDNKAIGGVCSGLGAFRARRVSRSLDRRSSCQDPGPEMRDEGPRAYRGEHGTFQRV